MPLVSIIIPCYNTERWVSEAVESCLQQTYTSLEIIVINDGSTDDSLEQLRKFGNKIILLDGPNRGAAQARNHALERATGDYIQFLDADDYLLPDKLERQMARLMESNADVVYGDWRHLTHHEDGNSEFDPIHLSGDANDLLEANLKGWWVPPFTLLYRREIVMRSGGWDDTTVPADDRDFFLSILFAGATVEYVSGCTGIYRRYGRVTLSTSSTEKWVRGHIRTLEKVEQRLTAKAEIDQYRSALAHSYYIIAHGAYDINRALHKSLLQKVSTLDKTFAPPKPAFYRWIRQILGLEFAEEVAGLKRRLLRQKMEY